MTQGYADFRVVSALAELTPDRRDFVITYVVEEGPRYHFGTVDADSAFATSPIPRCSSPQAEAGNLVQRESRSKTPSPTSMRRPETSVTHSPISTRPTIATPTSG